MSRTNPCLRLMRIVPQLNFNLGKLERRGLVVVMAFDF